LDITLVCASLALAISLFAAVDTPKRANLSAAAIVDKNIEARGGLQACGRSRRSRWRGNWVWEGIGGLRFQFQIQTRGPADSRSLRGRPRRLNCRL
ncbi:MAG: hypothetical protein DMG50_02820, partial [Acidobacteria bacterium]